MNDGEVRIPVGFEIDEGDLHKLKSEIAKITSAAERVRKRSGKNALSPFDSQTLQEDIGRLSKLDAMIGKIQQKVADTSKRTFAVDFSQASDEAEMYRKRLISLQKELKAAQSEKGGAGKKVSAAEEYTRKVENQIAEIQKSAADMGRALTEPENELIAKLREEADLRNRMAQEAYATASNSYSVMTNEVAKMQEAYDMSRQRIGVLSDIAESEQEIDEYERDIAEREAELRHSLYQNLELYKQIAREMQEILEKNSAAPKVDTEQLAPKEEDLKETAATIDNLSQAEKNLAHNTQAAAEASNEEAEATKSSTAQFYYKLRAIKMLGFVVNQTHAAMTNFGKKALTFATKAVDTYVKLITPIHTVRKALLKATATQKAFNREVGNTTKAHDKFNISLKQAVLTILKYGLGIRSLFVLFNKLRSAISTGLGEMSLQFDDVNENMSSIVTSMNQIKAALTSIIEPIVNVLAPVLERIAAVVSEIAYKVASFIAALTGQSAVYKATRVQTNYAESLDKTAKSAKEAKKQLSGLDKLNVINSEQEDDKNSGKQPTMGWTKVPIDSKMKDLADKFKQFLDRLLGPIKKAWDKMKDFVKQSWKYMLDELLKLGKDVARDFWRVWEEPETQKIFENIFKIVGDIFLIVGNLAKKIREAWNHNENGYRILKAIRDIIGIIVQGVTDIADYMVIWSDNLTFVPLFDAVADVLQDQVVPAVQKVVDLFVYLTKTVLLELVRYVIEELAPKLVKAFGNIVEAIGNIAENILKALQEGEKGEKIVKAFEDIITIIADGILEASEATKEWAKNLDFNNLFTAILNFLEKIKPLIQFIVDTVKSFWTNVLLPFWKYLIEDGGPKLLDLLGKIFGEQQTDENGKVWGIDFEHLKSVIEELMPVLEQFLELSWETFLQIIEDIGLAFDNFVNSGTLDDLVEKFKNWVNNADPEVLAEKIEKFVLAFAKIYAEITIVAKVIMPLVTGFMTLINVFKQIANPIVKVVGFIKTLIGAAGSGGFAGLVAAINPVTIAITAVIGVIALMVGAFGGVKETLDAVKERIDKVVEKLKEFAEKINLQATIDNLKSAFDNLKGSVTSLKPLFELLLDILAEAAIVLGKTLIGAIDGLVLAFTGLIDIIGGISDIIGGLIDIIVGLFTGDYVKADEGLSKLITGLGETFLGVGEVIGGVLNGIAEAMAGFIDEILPGVAEGVGTFVTNVKNSFEWLRNMLIGDPIVIDIQEGIVASFGEWIKSTATDVGNWVKDRVTDFQNLATGIGKTLGDAKDKVVTKFREMKEGVSEKAGELLTTAKEKFESVRDNAKQKFESSGFVQFGKNAVKGIESGIKAFGTVLSAVSKNASDIKSRFRSGLTLSTFRSLGSNVINALKGGLLSGLNSALQAVSSICNQITSKVKSAFQIHSPSKVFENIGQQLMSGLVIGVDENADKVGESFEELVPSAKMLDSFYDKFLDMMTKLTDNTTAMFDAMFVHIEDTMTKLEKLMSMTNISTTLDKLPQIQVPSIANGQKLPATKSFAQTSTELDLSKLPDIIKDAVIEALEDTIDLRNDDEAVIVNIDGKQLFKVVRDRNSEYKKQHGVSAFV